MSHHIISYHIISYHIISYHIISYLAPFSPSTQRRQQPGRWGWSGSPLILSKYKLQVLKWLRFEPGRLEGSVFSPGDQNFSRFHHFQFFLWKSCSRILPFTCLSNSPIARQMSSLPKKDIFAQKKSDLLTSPVCDDIVHVSQTAGHRRGWRSVQALPSAGGRWRPVSSPVNQVSI